MKLTNNINGVFVQRQITETIEEPTTYEMPEGLPFYYYIGAKTGGILIILGLIAFLVSFIGSGIFYYLLFTRKKARCKRCGHTFRYKKKEEPICPKCGAESIKI